MSCDLGSVKCQTLALYFIGAISGYGIELRGIGMAKVIIEGLDNIANYVESQRNKYTKWFNNAASADIYNAYQELADEIKIDEVGIHTAAKKIPGGIVVSGSNSRKFGYMNRRDPSKPALSYWSGSLYGEPYPKKWKYRSRVGGKSKVYHFTHALQITINNILDLVWDQGYVALPEKSINNPAKWRNPKGKWMRNISVTLGDLSYSGASAKTILETYAKDLSESKNSGREIQYAWQQISNDISKTFSK